MNHISSRQLSKQHIFETTFAKVSLIQAQYVKPYSELDFNLYHSISFPLFGSFTYKAGGQEILLDSNHVLLERSEVEFSVTKYKEFQRDTCMNIALNQSAFPISTLFSGNMPFKKSNRTASMATRLSFFMNSYKNGRQMVSEERLLELLEVVFTNLSDSTNHLPTASRFALLQKIEAVKEFIHYNYQNEVTLSNMAAIAHLSLFHFARTFKKFTGSSPYIYLTEVRIEEAKARLQKGMPVTQVAFETGFNSLENFSNAFRKTIGVAPTVFKKSKMY